MQARRLLRLSLMVRLILRDGAKGAVSAAPYFLGVDEMEYNIRIIAFVVLIGFSIYLLRRFL